MPTFAVVLRPSKVPATGRLALRVSAGKVTTFVALGLDPLPVDAWNPARQEVRKPHAHSADINSVITSSLRDAEEAYYALLRESGSDAARPSAHDVAGRVRALWSASKPKPPPPTQAARTPGESSSLVAMVLAFAKDREREQRYYYAARCRVLASHVAAVLDTPAGGAAGDRLSPAFVAALDAHLVARGMKPNSRSTLLRGLRTIARRAERESALEAGASARAFAMHRMPSNPTDKARLTRSELERVEALAVDMKAPRAAREAAAFFVIAVHLLGTRAGDVLALRASNLIRGEDGRPVAVSWRMGKTGTPMQVPLSPLAADLLARWEADARAAPPPLPVPVPGTRPLRRARGEAPPVPGAPPHLGGVDVLLAPQMQRYVTTTPAQMHAARRLATSALNARLRDVAAICEIDKPVTTHVARYTFGAVAIAAGHSRDEVQTMYAHASGRITDQYLGEVENEAIRAQAAGLFGAAQPSPSPAPPAQPSPTPPRRPMLRRRSRS